MEIEHRLPYIIHIDPTEHNTRSRKQMWLWCIETFGRDKTIWSWDGIQHSLDTFYFNDIKHANWFVLKWQ